jgi:addiction module HigA family antidote
MTNRKRQPTHPGDIPRRHYLEPMELTMSALADDLHVSGKTVSKIVNERGSITPDLALRLSRALNTTAEWWLNLKRSTISGRQRLVPRIGKR